RQVEYAGWKAIEKGQHLRGLHHIRILGIHIAEIDGVACLRAVEAALFDNSDAIVQAEGVNHGGTHAARRGGSGDADAVAAEQRQIARQIAAEEARWLLFVDDDILRSRRDWGDDRVAVEFARPRPLILLAARVLPQPGAAVPIIIPSRAGRVDYRNALLA